MHEERQIQAGTDANELTGCSNDVKPAGFGERTLQIAKLYAA